MASPTPDEYRVNSGETRVHRLLSKAVETQVSTVRMYGSTLVLPRERYFAGVEEMQAYVDVVRSRRWVWEQWPEKNMQAVKVRHRTTPLDSSYYRDGVITMANLVLSRRELKLLHELAHHYGGTGHGKKFREAYYLLVSGEMSPELAFLLRMSIEHQNEGEE